MAGFYADIPGQFMMWHIDGTVVQVYNGATLLQTVSAANMKAINGNNDAGYMPPISDANVNVFHFFPEDRDIDGIFLSETGDVNNVNWSSDATNGSDGTWNLIANPNNPTTTAVFYRSQISAYALTGVKVLRINARLGTFNSQRRLHTVHIYGRPSTGEAPDRLRLWHPTLDQELTGSYFDWGDVEQSSSTVLERDFRVKNPSATETATTPTLAVGFIKDIEPYNAAQHEFSDDGTTWASTLDLATLGAGVISPVVTIRRTTEGLPGLARTYVSVTPA